MPDGAWLFSFLSKLLGHKITPWYGVGLVAFEEIPFSYTLLKRLEKSSAVKLTGLGGGMSLNESAGDGDFTGDWGLAKEVSMRWGLARFGDGSSESGLARFGDGSTGAGLARFGDGSTEAGLTISGCFWSLWKQLIRDEVALRLDDETLTSLFSGSNTMRPVPFLSLARVSAAPLSGGAGIWKQ